MDPSDLQPLLEDLSANIDELEAILSPLLQNTITDNARRLPLLDTAKLNVLATYSIESLIFCYLRLSGVDAKEHPVFSELSRVKQYFAKIKTVETGQDEKKSNLQLDKGAADRFVKHGLAGNEKHDREREQALKEARERAVAKMKLNRMASPSQQQSSASEVTSQEQTTDEYQQTRSKRKRKTTSAVSNTAETPSDKDGSCDSASSDAEASSSQDSQRERQSVKNRANKKGGSPPKDSRAAFTALLSGPPAKHGKALRKRQQRKSLSDRI